MEASHAAALSWYAVAVAAAPVEAAAEGLSGGMPVVAVAKMK